MMPPAFVISCPQTGRLVPRFDFPVTTVQGVHGATWGIQATRPSLADPTYTIGPGHAGLDLTHWMIWQHVWIAGHDEALVMEDDVYFVPDFVHEFGELRRALPADWQFVFVGSVGTEQKDRRPVNSRVVQVDQPFGTHCYLVRRSALPLLIQNNQSARDHIDIQLWKSTPLRYYVAWPSLAGQRSFDGVIPSTT